MDIKIIVKDILLLELCEKKAQHIFLVNEEQVYEHCINLFLVSKIDLQRIQSYSICQYHQSLINNNFSFEKVIQEKYPIMFECLRLGNGILSICGILEEIVDTQQYNDICEHNITIYFHSCTIIEATILLEKCLLLFGNINFYLYNNNVCVYENNTAIIFCTTICNSLQELLINREHILEKQLWNPKDGYVTTLSTSIAIAFCSYPLDINLPCSQSEYYNSIGFSIILHGLGTINEVLEQQPIESFCLDSAENSYSNIESGEESFEPFANEQINKIYKDGMLQLPDCTFSFRQEELIIHEQKENSPYPYNPLAINTKRLSSKYIGKVNECINQIMAKCNFVEYIPVTRPNFNLQKYLGKNYKPYIVGIDNNRYVAFANSMRQYNLPKEVFRLLCEHWLTSEAMLAEDRLLSLHN